MTTELLVHHVVDGTLRQTNLTNESREYLAKREEIRKAELENMRQRENIAEMIRALPEGPEIDDYVFEEGPRDLNREDFPVRKVRLSELFTSPDRALIVYQMMYGKAQKTPCPMCTAWMDALNGIVTHVEQRADVAVVMAADIATIRAFARRRDWKNLRLLSAAGNTFKFDTGSEKREGQQDSTLSVFTLRDGKPRHFYTSHPWMAPDVKERGIDLLNPIWSYFDLTPQGRGDFYTKVEYPAGT